MGGGGHRERAGGTGGRERDDLGSRELVRSHRMHRLHSSERRSEEHRPRSTVVGVKCVGSEEPIFYVQKLAGGTRGVCCLT